MYAKFDKTLETGNELIDSQHKELISKINKLVESCVENKNVPEVLKRLEELEEYIDFHFTSEEAFLEDMNFSGLRMHRREHTDYIETFRQLHDVLDRGCSTRDFAVLINENVISWFYHHIKVYDHVFSDYKIYNMNELHHLKMSWRKN